MRLALAPLIFLSLSTGAKAGFVSDYVRENFIFRIDGSAEQCVTADWIGLPGAKVDKLKVSNEVELIGFHLPPKDDTKPLILYFHGQGGFRPAHFKDFVEHGYGVMAYAYRGYHRSGGSPNEADILKDAEVIYEKARESRSARIVVMGESIGTGVATILASRHEEAALVLDSPYDNIPMAAQTSDIVPGILRVLPGFMFDAAIADKFHADDAIKDVKAPVFMSVGCADGLIKYQRGETLYGLASSPKKLITGACVGHVPFASPDPRQSDEEKKERAEMLTKVIAWIDHPVDGGSPESCSKCPPPPNSNEDRQAPPAPAPAGPACGN